MFVAAESSVVVRVGVVALVEGIPAGAILSLEEEDPTDPVDPVDADSSKPDVKEESTPELAVTGSPRHVVMGAGLVLAALGSLALLCANGGHRKS